MRFKHSREESEKLKIEREFFKKIENHLQLLQGNYDSALKKKDNTEAECMKLKQKLQNAEREKEDLRKERDNLLSQQQKILKKF